MQICESYFNDIFHWQHESTYLLIKRNIHVFHKGILNTELKKAFGNYIIFFLQ